MEQGVKDLIEISRFYGNDNEFVIAGGGNTSYKNETTIYVKASGTSLGTIDENGFAVLDRKKLGEITTKEYSSETVLREEQVKTDLLASRVDVNSKMRPSVETSLHDCMPYQFVIHTHPTFVNALMCSQNAEKLTKEWFKEALYVPYTDPGYILFKRVDDAVKAFRKEYGYDTKIIFIQNHGVFVAADTIEEIKSIYDSITNTLKSHIPTFLEIQSTPISGDAKALVAEIQNQLPEKTVQIRNSNLIELFTASLETYQKIALPFTPDIIVYCKAFSLFVDESTNISSAINEFTAKNGYSPRIIIAKNKGLIGIEDDAKSVEIILDIYEDFMKIAHYSENFGGQHPMTDEQIYFICNWEAENYRRSLQMPKK
jgi:rhamnose utilization protein RhaD (predicted bifunctional aldolase and dehydrogenase)